MDNDNDRLIDEMDLEPTPIGPEIVVKEPTVAELAADTFAPVSTYTTGSMSPTPLPPTYSVLPSSSQLPLETDNKSSTATVTFPRAASKTLAGLSAIHNEHQQQGAIRRFSEKKEKTGTPSTSITSSDIDPVGATTHSLGRSGNNDPPGPKQPPPTPSPSLLDSGEKGKSNVTDDARTFNTSSNDKSDDHCPNTREPVTATSTIESEADRKDNDISGSDVVDRRGSGIKRGRGRPRIHRGRPVSRQICNSNKDRLRHPPPELFIVNDEEPDRLTNPLLAMVPACFRKRQNRDNIQINRHSNMARGVLVTPTSSKTADTNTISAGKGRREGKDIAHFSNATGTIPAEELMNSASLVFHRPDTYPISFLARVLGFDVDVPDCNNILSLMSNEERVASNLSSTTLSELASGKNPQIPCFPVPLPDPQTLPLRNDAIFRKIPTEGSYFRDQRLQSRYKFNHSKNTTSGLPMGDRHDQRTLDYIDPVYKTLLQHGWEINRCKAAASRVCSKFILQQQEQQLIRHQVTEMAQQLLGLSTDWTFQDWRSFASQREKTQQLQNKAIDSILDVVPDNDEIATANDASMHKQQRQEPLVPSPSQQHRNHDTGEHHHDEPLWTIDGKEVFSNLPQHVFGILASYQGRPFALLKYQFHWYQLHSDESEMNKNKDLLESELVVVVDGIGYRTDDNGETGGDETTCAQSCELVDEGVVDPQKPAQDPHLDQEDQEQVVQEKVRTRDDPQTTLPVRNNSTNIYRRSDENKVVVPLSPIMVELNDTVKVVMLAMAFEHTRACNVLYGLWEVPEALVDRVETCFRMVKLSSNYNTVAQEGDSRSSTCDVNGNNFKGNVDRMGGNQEMGIAKAGSVYPMICDLKKCSSRYALLKLKDVHNGNISEDNIPESTTSPTSMIVNNDSHALLERLLVKMPSFDQAKLFFEGSRTDSSCRHSKRGTDEDAASNIFTGAVDSARKVVLKLRAKVGASNEDKVEIFQLDSTSGLEEEILALPSSTIEVTHQTAATGLKLGESIAELSNELSEAKRNQDFYKTSLSWDILRCFPITREIYKDVKSGNEILSELIRKQEELIAVEKSLEPQVRDLLTKAVVDRMKYELPESRHQREDMKHTLGEYKEYIARRKEFDQVCQEQREEDMNAVCSICNDGEVTPENQIIFCEACNVAVHQICYGVEKIPEGDYYCIACRHFKRDQMIQSKPDSALNDAATVPRSKLPPLPIVCELCPLKKGAYTRLDDPKSTPNSSSSKWIHMTCAKWQGLDFVRTGDASLVEDVTQLKQHFRRRNISCCICKGMRGAYIQCRHDKCQNWCHITCARESGLCEVVHGENVDGTINDNPWTLLCPDHSNIEKEEQMTCIEQLIRAAKEFPVDPMPPPILEELKPFNKLTGEERKSALAVRKYEDEFMDEVLSKKLSGVRCEVCDIIEDVNGKNLRRCISCGCVICFSCELSDDQGQRYFECYSCRSLKETKNAPDTTKKLLPQCSLCNQKGGLLVGATSEPMLKLGYWKKNTKEYEKSLFTKAKWAHILCS